MTKYICHTPDTSMAFSCVLSCHCLEIQTHKGTQMVCLSAGVSSGGLDVQTHEMP